LERLFDDVAAASHLIVMDDILGRKLTPHELDHIVFRLIDIAHRNNAGLVVTTNHSIEELRAILNPHEMSRILDGVSEIMHLTGKDWRPGAK
jgi:DNA replication protein DnaC